MSNGARRPSEECRADPGLKGTLTVSDIATGNAERRPLRMASLSEPHGVNLKRQLVAPLFDVELLRITSKGMLLRGFQIDASGKAPVQHAQEWWCEPTADAG
jgi:hypothetical protein